MRIVVHNTGDRRIENVVIRIALPDAKQVVRSDAPLLASNARTARIAVPPLGPREAKVLSVTLGGAW
jgi:hypothetical protein